MQPHEERTTRSRIHSKRRREIAAGLSALAAAMTICISPARAQGTDPWQFQATIYAYLPDIGGTTSFPQSGTGGVTVDAATILDNLKFTFMGAFEARKGPWGAYTDVIYLDLGNHKSQSRDISIGGSPLPAGATADVNFDLKGWTWTLAGERNLVSTDGATLDVLAGARLFDLEQTLGWSVTGNVGPIPAPGRAGTSKAKLSNVDVLVGAKGRLTFGKDGKWIAPYYADIGTGDSDLTWQLMAGVGYSFQWGDVIAAWRHIDYEMKSGKAIESMNFDGPAIAATFRW